MMVSVPDGIAERFIASIEILNERLQLETALQGQPVLTVADLCTRWKISARSFHRDYRDKLPQCNLLKGQLRFLLADIVTYEQTHRVKPDGTPLAPVAADKRAMKRKKPSGDEFPQLKAV